MDIEQLLADETVAAALEQVYTRPVRLRQLRHAFRVDGNGTMPPIKDLLLAFHARKAGVKLDAGEANLPLLDTITSVAKSRVQAEAWAYTFGDMQCLTGDRPAALDERVGKTVTVPAVETYESEPGQYALSYNFDIPVVFSGPPAQRCIIPEISTANYDSLYARGGGALFRSTPVTLNRVCLIHDKFLGVNYAHWMLDWLPRIELLRRAGADTGRMLFVLPRRMSAFQAETLAHLGIDADRVVEAVSLQDRWTGFVGFREFFATSTSGPLFLHALYQGSPWAVEFLRRSFIRGAPGRNWRLVLNRKGSRRLHFDDTANALLHRHGFEVVFTEGMSVLAQAALFAGAEAVLAGHGAGLANLVFCGEGTNVLEVFPSGHSTAAFWIAATAAGLNYACAAGDRVEIAGARAAKDHDILVTGDLVARWLETWG